VKLLQAEPRLCAHLEMETTPGPCCPPRSKLGTDGANCRNTGGRWIAWQNANRSVACGESPIDAHNPPRGNDLCGLPVSISRLRVLVILGGFPICLGLVQLLGGMAAGRWRTLASIHRPLPRSYAALYRWVFLNDAFDVDLMASIGRAADTFRQISAALLDTWGWSSV